MCVCAWVDLDVNRDRHSDNIATKNDMCLVANKPEGNSSVRNITEKKAAVRGGPSRHEDGGNISLDSRSVVFERKKLHSNCGLRCASLPARAPMTPGIILLESATTGQSVACTHSIIQLFPPPTLPAPLTGRSKVSQSTKTRRNHALVSASVHANFSSAPGGHRMDWWYEKKPGKNYFGNICTTFSEVAEKLRFGEMEM